jgi:hypothetical protein
MQVSAFGRGELSVRHFGTRCYEKQIFGLGGAKIWSKACSFFGVPAVSVRLFGDLSSARAVLNEPKASSAGIAIVVGSGAIDLFPPAYNGSEVFLHQGGGIK